MASPPTLQLIAKSHPAPYGLVALANSLPPSAHLSIDYVHSFTADAPKGTNVALIADGYAPSLSLSVPLDTAS